MADRDYWEQRLATHEGLAGVGYIGLGKAFNGWMYRARRATFLRHVRPLIAPVAGGLDVLDIGSGTGFYVDRWTEIRVRSITGSDITDTAVSRLSQRYPAYRFERFDVGSGEAPFEDRSFGAVSAFDVLFHIVDDDRYETAVRTIHRLLRPGGHFLLSDNFLHGKELRTPTQVSRSLDRIESVLDAAGFEVVTRRPALSLMNYPVDSDSRVRQLGWTAISRIARTSEATAWATGALLYPFEVGLATRTRESPTTELMICRRR